MDHQEWLERAETYAVGALDREELTQFEAHLAAGCPLCEERLRETRETLALIPGSLTPIDPPPSVKAGLLRRIAGEPALPAAEKPWSGWLWWGIGAGALVAASLLMTLSWNLSRTRQELQRLQGQMAARQSDIAQREELIRVLSDPQARLIQLTGLPASPAATGRLLWNPVTRKGLLLTTGLPATPPDKSYELWAIAGEEPVPAGVFKVDLSGRALFRLPALIEGKQFDTFAVTLEPAGGVPKPSGPMHLLGKL